MEVHILQFPVPCIAGRHDLPECEAWRVIERLRSGQLQTIVALGNSKACLENCGIGFQKLARIKKENRNVRAGNPICHNSMRAS
ncbi:hypothetical protein AVEN_103493-1 [Araneus ventricosus]|uniref:Uncharacterized protein n=1 Tax=Araneus ventricosus TaxID=182803 RepID=A0A4Y2I0R9_ARAVE|nr:hypothetical protein AVEN_103493-1 [Araneus ventricosus]